MPGWGGEDCSDCTAGWKGERCLERTGVALAAGSDEALREGIMEAYRKHSPEKLPQVDALIAKCVLASTRALGPCSAPSQGRPAQTLLAS